VEVFLPASTRGKSLSRLFFFNFTLYLQSVPIRSEHVAKSCTKACGRVLTSTLLYLMGSEFSCYLESVTYKLNLKNYIYNYILNQVGRSISKFFRNHDNGGAVNGVFCRSAPTETVTDTRPLVREGTPHQQTRNSLTLIIIWSWATDGCLTRQTVRLTVGRNITLTFGQQFNLN
jgi:hypothetical protein